MHCSPAPAHPSYRLITALRLYHLFPAVDSVPPSPDDAIKPWLNTISGIQETISDENEQAWRDSLLRICDGVVHRADAAARQLDAAGCDKSLKDTLRNLRMLWREERIVAVAVRQSLCAKVEF